MKKTKISEDLATLRQNELIARNNHLATFNAYYDAVNDPVGVNTISCGDDRLPIIKKVIKGFNDDKSISYPEEVDKDEFVSNVDEYEHWMGIVAHSTKLQSKANGKKVAFGVKVADDFKSIHDYVTLKSDKNHKYVDIAKETAIYNDPNGKRKETKLEKNRTERAAKKNPPKS